MRIHEITDKLTAERLQQLSDLPAWQAAAAVGWSWQRAVRHPRQLQPLYAELSDWGRAALSIVMLRFGTKPFELQGLLAAATEGSFSGAELKQGLRELVWLGIIFTQRKLWGDELHFLPQDTFAPWFVIVYPSLLEPVQMQQSAISPTQSPPATLSRQLLGAYSALLQSGMQLTAKGWLQKKVTDRMLKRLQLTDQQLAPLNISFKEDQPYTLPIALAVDIAIDRGWLRLEDGAYTWQHAAWSEWLELRLASKEAWLLQEFIARYLGLNRNASYAAAFLAGLRGSQWYAEENAAVQLRGIITTEESLNTVIALFSAMGWMEQAWCGNERMFRWLIEPFPEQGQVKSQALPNHSIQIAPNGEVIVMREASDLVRWRLEPLAEFKSEQTVSVYQVTAASISAALESGLSQAELLDRLTEALGTALPASITAVIQAVSERAGRISISEKTLLCCDHAELARRIALEPLIAPFLLEQLGEKVFVVEAAQMPELRKRLARIGLPARKEQEAAVQSAATNSKRGQPSLLLQADSLNHYRLVSDLPEASDLYPGMEDIPTAWIEQLRSYHVSTRREMLQHALRWQTPVELCRDRRRLAFVPARIEDREDGWLVAGRFRDAMHAEAEVVLSPDMWQEMRLVLPGHANE